MTDGREARAEAIRVARARHHITQEEIAQLSGLDQTTVSQAERGGSSEATYDAIDAAYAELDAKAKAAS